MKLFKVLLILFLLNSCDVATPSEKEVPKIFNLTVKINIEDGTKKNVLNLIQVFLTNGKKQIINSDIKIELNGKPLELFVRQGNYYDKHSYYGTDDLLRSESYYFEITLADGIKYPLAFIKPNKIVTEFNFPKNISTVEDFIIKWTNLNSPFTFNYVKGVDYEREADQADNITKSGYDGKRTDTLNTITGEFIIPKSYFIVSKQKTKRLETTLLTKETGLMNSMFKKNSSVTYSYKLKKSIYIDKNE